jgi:UDP-N-acetylglucosamine 1-carboxyvinyltransferase
LRAPATILQPEASVTATENTLMAAVLAPGETIIDNAASEPHVQELCELLNQMGAQIEGIGTNRLTIQGVAKLHGTEFTIGSRFYGGGQFYRGGGRDGRLQSASNGPHPKHLAWCAFLPKTRRRVGRRRGGHHRACQSGATHEHPTLAGRIPEIKPMPWPGFPPDLMSILVVIATQSHGSVLLHDWMYESRFFFTDKLVFMGARIVMCDPHRVIVDGGSALHASPQGVPSPDIRAGMALVLAALCARRHQRYSQYPAN